MMGEEELSNFFSVNTTDLKKFESFLEKTQFKIRHFKYLYLFVSMLFSTPLVNYQFFRETVRIIKNKVIMDLFITFLNRDRIFIAFYWSGFFVHSELRSHNSRYFVEDLFDGISCLWESKGKRRRFKSQMI